MKSPNIFPNNHHDLCENGRMTEIHEPQHDILLALDATTLAGGIPR